MNAFTAGEGKIPFVFFLFFFFFASMSLSAATLEIIRPLSGTILDDSEISIVVKVNDPSVSKVIFTDTKGDSAVREIVKGKEVYCQSLSAEMGENHISVSAFHGADKVADSSVSVYYRSEIFSKFQEAPSGYKKIAFHTDKDEQLCKSCHKIIKGVSQYVVHDNPEDSTCFRCHKNIVNRAKGHAPSLNWMCTECHTGIEGEYGEGSGSKSKYTAPDPIMERCFSCHENIKKLWFSRKSEHGPVRDGRCNRCHNPHASNELFFLRKPIWDLCTTCHAEKASGAHVISSFVRDKSHPMKGKPDPSRPGRELVCSGCHDPHGSDGIFLLRSKGKTAFSICVRCHKK